MPTTVRASIAPPFPASRSLTSQGSWPPLPNFPPPSESFSPDVDNFLMKTTLFHYFIGFLSLLLIASFAIFQLASIRFRSCPRPNAAIPSSWVCYQSRTLKLTIWHPANAEVFVNPASSRVDFEMGYPGQAVTLVVQEQTSSHAFEPPDNYSLRGVSLGCESYRTSTVLVGDRDYFSETCIWPGTRTPVLAQTTELTELPDGQMTITTVIDPYSTASSSLTFSVTLDRMLSSITFGG